MSHSVRITHTTTSTSTSALILNTGYLKTAPGFLKLLQLIIGAVCVGIVSYYMRNYRVFYNGTFEIFFLLMSVSFLIGTFCLLLSCLLSLSTGGIISKTIYELIYHTIAFVLYLIAAILLLVEINENRYNSNVKDSYMAASELIYHTIAFVLYLIAAILLLVEINENRYNSNVKDSYMAASILGLINAGLYLISSILAQRSYRGI